MLLHFCLEPPPPGTQICGIEPRLILSHATSQMLLLGAAHFSLNVANLGKCLNQYQISQVLFHEFILEFINFIDRLQDVPSEMCRLQCLENLSLENNELEFLNPAVCKIHGLQVSVPSSFSCSSASFENLAIYRQPSRNVLSLYYQPELILIIQCMKS